jgi:hypothetical protein
MIETTKHQFLDPAKTKIYQHMVLKNAISVIVDRRCRLK